MKIGILNTGNVGSRLARAWAAAGHELVLAKDGEDRKLAPLLAELGDRARLGTIREAAEFGEVVLFSVYWPRVEAVVAEVGGALDGKVVIETMNPLGVTAEFKHFHDLDFMRDGSTAEDLQRRLPKARVVKAFSMLAAPVLEAAAWASASTAPGVPYASDDAKAGSVARGLITDAGFKPLAAGPLSAARQIEQLGVFLHHVADHEYGGDRDLIRLALAVVEASPGPVMRGLADATPEAFDTMVAVHARAPFFMVQSALKRLRDGGRIVNVSSAAGTRAMAAVPIYSMAKAAVSNLTHALAAELGPRGITVNAVAPGWVRTDMNAAVRESADMVKAIEADTALGRFGETGDIAAVVAFLASDEGRWVTAQIIEASGGYKL